VAEDTGTLAQETHRLFQLLDALDISGLTGLLADDAQAVDELTSSWMRGREALQAHFARLPEMVADVRSQVSDLSATVWGDVGLVTLQLDQTYTVNGEVQKISAPTSLLYRRQGETWKLALVHSVPITAAAH
jgi:ketosteroid isomerase-like protein